MVSTAHQVSHTIAPANLRILSNTLDPTYYSVRLLHFTPLFSKCVGLCLCGLWMILCIVNVVSAQEGDVQDNSPEADIILDTLVVSARKWEEPSFQVPGQITVFSNDFIENARIRNADNLGFFTPSLTFINPGNPIETPLIIRGVGLAYGIGEYSVGLFLDGIYQGADIFYSQDLFDVERIEILKGSQSTLYGKSTIGGVVNVITKDPTPNPEFEAKSTLGSDGLFNGFLVGSGPLVQDRLFARVALDYKDFDGYYTNQFTGKSRDVDRQQGLRIKVLAYPTDELEVIPVFSYRKRDADSYVYHKVSDEKDYHGEPYDVNNPPTAEIEASKGSLTFNYYPTSGYTLTSITAVSRVDEDDLIDIDYSSTASRRHQSFFKCIHYSRIKRIDLSQEMRLIYESG